MRLSEAEIQVLVSICATECEGLATNRVSIDGCGDVYWIFKEDWSEAYDVLIRKGLVRYDGKSYLLTELGQPVAEKYRSERPDMYWYLYQKFYSTAHSSATYSKFCEKVFGRDLCQDGQTDMAALDHLLKLLDLQEGQRVLDIGCGAGVISEYISDETGAVVIGIDYTEAAIADANARTTQKRARLKFRQGNINSLELERSSYNALISLDTLYWAADLETTLAMLAPSLKPDGQMGIFLNHHIEHTEPEVMLKAEHSDLFKVLRKLNLQVDTIDYTQNIKQFWPRLYSVVTELKDAFKTEGNEDIAKRLIYECEVDYLPDVENDRIARYLYHVRMNA